MKLYSQPIGPLPPPPEPVGPFLKIGGYVDKTSASLRFFDDTLDPEQVTRLLGCPPTQSCRKGDLLPSKRCQRIARTGSWRLQTPKDDSRTLEEQIASLLDRVTVDLAAWKQVPMGGRADVFCGLHLRAWNRGFSLSPDLMARLAERRLTVEFDIYCEGEDETEPSAV